MWLVFSRLWLPVVSDCLVVSGDPVVAVLCDCGYCGSGFFVVSGCLVVTGLWLLCGLRSVVALWLWLLCGYCSVVATRAGS